MIYSSGSDGTLNCTDLEIGMPTKAVDLNPDGWNVSGLGFVGCKCFLRVQDAYHTYHSNHPMH